MVWWVPSAAYSNFPLTAWENQETSHERLVLKPDEFGGRVASCKEWLSGCHLPRKPQVIVQVSGLHAATALSTWFCSTCSSPIHIPFSFATCVSVMFLVNCVLFSNTKENQSRSELTVTQGKSENLRSIYFNKTDIWKTCSLQPSFTPGCRHTVKCSSGESSCTGHYLHCVKNFCLGL